MPMHSTCQLKYRLFYYPYPTQTNPQTLVGDSVYFGSPLKALAIMEHFSIEQLLPLPLMLMVINQVAAQRTEN
ncbi:hypothetical protein TYRP_005586 [Tyrophagus putrescentiae]|nr:hypothetical protein TYRP_005586 [Tyrophagus putrescentiae]